MYYLLHQRPENIRVDFFIKGVALDENNTIIPNILNIGEPLYPNKYKIKILDEYSNVGKLKDRLWVEVNITDKLLVVSDETVELLKEFNSPNIEFLEVEIFGKNTHIEGYKIVNIIEKVDCINDEMSELIYFDDTNIIHAVEELVINEDLIPSDLDIFMLARNNNPVIVFHEKVVNAIEEKGLNGFLFVKPEDFSIG